MAFDGTDNCWIPDRPIGLEEDWRLRVAQFGDGYAQRILDGINALNQTWHVTFQGRQKDVILNMLDFLHTQKGNSFQFKEPVSGVMYDVWCDKWNVDWIMRRPGPTPVNPYWYGNLTADFVRAYGITQ